MLSTCAHNCTVLRYHLPQSRSMRLHQVDIRQLMPAEDDIFKLARAAQRAIPYRAYRAQHRARTMTDTVTYPPIRFAIAQQQILEIPIIAIFPEQYRLPWNDHCVSQAALHTASSVAVIDISSSTIITMCLCRNRCAYIEHGGRTMPWLTTHRIVCYSDDCAHEMRCLSFQHGINTDVCIRVCVPSGWPAVWSINLSAIWWNRSFVSGRTHIDAMATPYSTFVTTIGSRIDLRKSICIYCCCCCCDYCHCVAVCRCDKHWWQCVNRDFVIRLLLTLCDPAQRMLACAIKTVVEWSRAGAVCRSTRWCPRADWMHMAVRPRDYHFSDMYDRGTGPEWIFDFVS